MTHDKADKPDKQDDDHKPNKKADQQDDSPKSETPEKEEKPLPEQALRPKAGTKIHLADYSPEYTANLNKKKTIEDTEKMHERLGILQEMLYAQRKQSVLVVLQAMDAGGKDGVLRKVFTHLNPAGIRISSFKAPTEEELAHDFLWRIHKEAPPKGYIGVFNRSHYEDVLVVRVNKLAPPDVWRKRYDHINAFEQLLADSGTRILKFFLHISKEEQKERLMDRLQDPNEQWKFSAADLPVREKWDKYMQAYEDAISHCNTEAAPWHIIPGNHKWYRNYVITRTLLETLESMDLSYPPAEKGLEDIEIPD
jgi:PPK2 family polyphosphate:nucleotide phosphotransferase